MNLDWPLQRNSQTFTKLYRRTIWLLMEGLYNLTENYLNQSWNETNLALGSPLLTSKQKNQQKQQRIVFDHKRRFQRNPKMQHNAEKLPRISKWRQVTGEMVFPFAVGWFPLSGRRVVWISFVFQALKYLYWIQIVIESPRLHGCVFSLLLWKYLLSRRASF